MKDISGNCGKCGAPYYTATIWHGTITRKPFE